MANQQSTPSNATPAKVLGLLVALIGSVTLIGSTTLDTVSPGTKVHNIGLLNQRLVYVMASSVATLSGVVLLSAGLIMDEVKR